MLINLPNEAQLLLCCAFSEMDEETTREAKSLLENPLDWPMVLEVARGQGISAILYRNLKRVDDGGKVPEVYFKDLQMSYFRTAIYNIQLREAAGEVLKALESRGIKVIVLKGLALSETVYKNVAVRPMSDVDLLVHKQDIGAVSEIFFRSGYVYNFKDKLFGNALSTEEILSFTRSGNAINFQSDKGHTFDVHWELTSLQDRFKIDLEEIWANSVPGKIAGIDVLLMSPTDQLLYLCINAARNLYFPLTCLCDITAVIKLYERQINWDYITKNASKWLAKNAAYYALFLTKHLLGASIPESVLDEISPKGFTGLVFKFGKEDILYRKNNLMEGTCLPLIRLVLRDRFRDRVTVFLSIFTSWSSLVKISCSQMSKIPIIRWLINPFRLLIKGIIALLLLLWRVTVKQKELAR